MEQKENKERSILECIKVVNGHPNKLNDEGKLELAQDIIEELPLEELNKFLIKWGYKR